MAKRQIRDYVFTPGVAGFGRIKVLDKISKEQILLITNTTANEILYSFSDPLKQIIVEFDETTLGSDPDFPYANTLSNGVTTIHFQYNTTQYSSTDTIQIFVESEDLKIRPYDFGTDAIERMRMAAPQSMIDADFEYGIQPTKWQAIDLMRGYPSIYEQPGADLSVSAIVTDASNGTGNIGPSLISVTTENDHGFSVGDPITLRGISDNVIGFSKAEGSFIISSITDSKNFAFYAKGRVGTSPATSLFASAVQLRRAGFYSGSEIGTPTFSIASNGASGQVSTRGVNPSGANIIGVNTGTMPPIGSPLSGTGLPAGTQVSAVVNLSSTLAITSSFTAPSSTIIFNETSGIAIGSALDNGSGTTIFVTNIEGNTVSLSSPYTISKSGNSFNAVSTPGAPVNFGLGSGAQFNVDRTSGAYVNVAINPDTSYSYIMGNYVGLGSGAAFGVERRGANSGNGTYTNVFKNASGSGYSASETITILGSSVGGSSPANDIVITILTVTATGGIDTFSYTGTAANTITKRGSNYTIGEKIVIYGNALGGTSPANDLNIVVTGVSGSGGITNFLAFGDAVPSTRQYNFLDGPTSGSGINASFNVTRTGSGNRVAQVDEVTVGGSVETDDIFTVTINGTGYSYTALAGNTLTAIRNGLITAINSGQSTVFAEVGSSPEKLTITAISAGTAFTSSVSTTEGGGGAADSQTITRITLTPNESGNSSPSYSATVVNGGSGYQPNDTITILGSELGGTTPSNNLIITVTSVNAQGGIQAFSVAGTAWNGNAQFFNIGPNPVAFNATFLPRIVSGAYSPTVTSGGTGYSIGYQFRIVGTTLGGSSPANDMIITVSNINDSGAITEVTATGTPLTGDTIAFFPSISLTTNTTQSLPASTTLNYSAIAKIRALFTGNHGLVPGDTILTAITSAGTNHTLAAGPFFVDDVPALNELIYTARSTGTISVSPLAITGKIYARPDSFYTHRPFDGGVQLGTGGPSHGSQAIRQSKKYVRYQSGKGIMYTTGALFAPSYDLRSVTASGTTIGSVITVITDDVDHGLQVGAEIALSGIRTSGFDNHYTVSSIIDEVTFTVLAINNLGSTTAEFDIQPQVSLYKWKGATVRAGAFDDQNGIFFQYDGTNISVGLRSSTYQIAGTITATPDSNVIDGLNTKFIDQLVVGDRIVIRGMSHIVTKIDSQTRLYVNPDYRGISTAANIKTALTREIIIPQNEWNIDRADGSGKSGYNIKINKMQMIGFQYSWYGAGFIDWMLRGPSGNFIFLHRLKNNNRNTEAFMRSGNLPVRYEVINEGPKAKLTQLVTASSTSLPVDDASLFPSSGVVYVDNELIRYSDKTNTSLSGLTRSSILQNFVAGANRTYTAGSAASHTKNTGVILVSNTATPQISHWGSAFLTDGGFDEDRGYIFNYQANTVSVSTAKSTVFLIRLSPSVSNALTGDLGERELINRAQLLLQGIEVTTQGGSSSQGVVIEGVLNPQNYPSDPSNIQWFGLNTAGSGGQPSFAQIARGATVTWKGSATPVTASNVFAQGTTNYVVFNRSAVTGVQIGWSISGTGVPGGTTVVNFINYDSSRIYIQFSQAVNTGGAGSSSYTFAPQVAALPGEQVFSFVASPGQRDELRLDNLKELTNTPIGGRGTFPNGPDVLAINAYLTSGAAVTSTIVLRWGEAQA